LKRKIATCKVCGWHGWIIHHNTNHCERYLRIKKMYLSGMTSREIGKELGTSGTLVLNVLKAVRVKTRSPGGLNNPGGINGRSRLTPLHRADEPNPQSINKS